MVCRKLCFRMLCVTVRVGVLQKTNQTWTLGIKDVLMFLIFDVTYVVTSCCDLSSYTTQTLKRIESDPNLETIGANIIYNTLGLLVGICFGNPKIKYNQEICRSKKMTPTAVPVNLRVFPRLQSCGRI